MNFEITHKLNFQPGGVQLADKVSTTEEINVAIKKQLRRSKTVKISGLSGQNYIAMGLSIEKQLMFEGTAGDFFGAFNNGSIVNLKGDARRFVGNNITNGGIIIQGNVQRGVGLGMIGGIIVIRGNVKGDIGQLAKGGTIIISGNTGAKTGAYMFNGELIIAGDVGEDTGLLMTGGAIFVGGKIGSLGENAQVRKLTKTDESKLKKYFDHYGIKKSPDEFEKIVPVTNRPLKDKLFDLTGNLQERERLSESWSEAEINNIINKTKTVLLSLTGPDNASVKLNKNFRSYFDTLSIIPAQTKPIKIMDLLGKDLDTQITIGEKLESPLVLDNPFYLSSRGAGVVGKSCKMAYIYATGKNNSALATGGSTFTEEYELNKKHGGKLIHQWNSIRLGVDAEYFNRCHAIEIVIGNGGSGSLQPIIPSEKISTELSEMWHIPQTVDIIPPPKFLDLDVPADLKRHVEMIREITEHKLPVFIKFAAGSIYEDTKLAIRAGADAIVLEGFDAYYQNTPTVTANNLGVPSIATIPQAVKALKDTRAGNRGVKLIIAGKLKSGADIFKALALGANCVVISNAAEIAIGCDLCCKCYTNNCSKGIATTNPEHEIKLDWVEAGQRLDNFLRNLSLELRFLMTVAGYSNILDFNIECLRALDYDTAAVTGAALVGYEKKLPMWEH